MGIIYSPLIGIGLTETPNSGWAKAHPAHPLTASLQFHSFFSVYNCSCYSPALSMTLLRLKERGYCHANQRKRSVYSMPCTVAVFASYCPMNMRPFLPSKSVTSTAKKLHPKHNFLVTIEAYLSHSAQTFQNLFDLCLHWVFVVRASKYSVYT